MIWLAQWGSKGQFLLKLSVPTSDSTTLGLLTNNTKFRNFQLYFAIKSLIFYTFAPFHRVHAANSKKRLKRITQTATKKLNEINSQKIFVLVDMAITHKEGSIAASIKKRNSKGNFPLLCMWFCVMTTKHEEDFAQEGNEIHVLRNAAKILFNPTHFFFTEHCLQLYLA